MSLGNVIYNFVNTVGHNEQISVIRTDHSLGNQSIFNPIDQPTPKLGADQRNWVVRDLSGLNHAQGLKKLIESAEATRQAHKRLAVFQKHSLADEEVADVQPELHKVVEMLLVG